MEIIIKGTPKEIAELALELQGRQSKNHEEKSTPKYETREFHIFCGNAIDSNSQNQQGKERTVEDVKKRFEKTLRDLGLSKD